MTGRLILCATPIGNLEDITLRALRVLREADVIACEDAKRTRKLLSHFEIPARSLIVYNEGNERHRAPELVGRIGSGRTVVLVSDAGMPGMSDPGYRLVRLCIDKDISIEVVPGPSAGISALVLSGLAPGRFAFEGFLPRRSGDRRRRIESLAAEQRTLLFYESPHRLAACMQDLADLLGDRRAVVARELTKMHEEVRRGTLIELASWAAEESPRGEVVIVVEGAIGSNRALPSADELAARARALMDQGVDRKEALGIVAANMGVARRKVFDALVSEKESAG